MNYLLSNKFRTIMRGIQMIQPNSLAQDLISASPFKLMNSYVGSGLCGPACFMVKNVLLERGIEGRVKKTLADPIYLNGDYLADHCVIYLEDGTIIDPTVRQLLVDERAIEGDKYLDYLKNSVPPIFVGTVDQYQRLLGEAIRSNSTEYGRSFISEKRLINYCNYPIDIDYRFTMSYLHSLDPTLSHLIKEILD